MIEIPCQNCGKIRKLTMRTSSTLCRSCARKKLIQDKKINYPTKLCKFCSEPFIPNNNKQIYCKRDHYRICPVCGKSYLEDNVENLKRLPVACSYECRVKQTQSTSLKKYGCTAPGNNPEARAKSRLTMLDHLGVEYAMQSKEVQNKSKSTLLNKYGVDNAAKNKEIIQKRMQSLTNTYQNNGGSAISKLNRSFKNMLENNDCKVELEYALKGKSFDIYLPETNTLIEINPTYTHNSIGNHWGDGLDKYYHRDKTQLAIENGFKCINIWDWDNMNIIAKMFKPKQILSSEDLQVFKLNIDVTNQFLNENHYSGSRRGQLLCLGLVKDDEIYQVMTFGKPTYDNSHSVQLYRMCTKLGYQIDNGYDKLSRSASEFGLYDIIAYSDLSKSDGSEYENIGMKFIRQTPPRLIWSKENKYVNSSLITVGKYIYHSEKEMLENGWLPVYDCGQKVYEFI